MTDVVLDFKDQMAEARRTQILLGAAQVFSEKGFHKATTKEIAKAAGVSEGTIYNYFTTKRDLLVAMIDLLAIQSLKNIIMAEPTEDPRQLFAAIMRNRHQLAVERGHLIIPIIAEIFTDAELREIMYQQIVTPLAAHLEAYIQTHIDAGHFRPINPMVATRTFVGSLLVNFARKLSGLDPRYNAISIDELIEEMVTLFLQGLEID
jgi:AcrR family transcriptional regulator